LELRTILARRGLTIHELWQRSQQLQRLRGQLRDCERMGTTAVVLSFRGAMNQGPEFGRGQKQTPQDDKDFLATMSAWAAHAAARARGELP
jgi:hypothetical protein